LSLVACSSLPFRASSEWRVSEAAVQARRATTALGSGTMTTTCTTRSRRLRKWRKRLRKVCYLI
jgi:hypothetical protein